MRYALKIAYDGTDLCGWQVQPNGPTVQAALEEAVFSAFGVTARVTGSGRTDSGVHALGQVAHVDLPLQIPGERLADALNPFLPPSVSITASAAAPSGFDANRSAKKKTYCYRFYCAARKNPLLERYACRVEGALSAEKMREAASLFVGEHDFKAYCASGSQVKTTVREIYSVEIFARQTVDVEVCGNGFLYNMVRTMAGTLLWYSLGKITLDDIRASLDCGNRALVGKTLPAKGLVLKEVDYGFALFGD